MITDDGRLERGKRIYGFSEMVRKTGFEPVVPCSPSTRSAWLSYVMMKNDASNDAETSKVSNKRVCL